MYMLYEHKEPVWKEDACHNLSGVYNEPLLLGLG